MVSPGLVARPARAVRHLKALLEPPAFLAGLDHRSMSNGLEALACNPIQLTRLTNTPTGPTQPEITHSLPG